MPYWGNIFMYSAATCALTLGYLRYSKWEETIEDEINSECEGKTSDVQKVLLPPRYTIVVAQISLVTTGLYLALRLFKEGFRGGVYYLVSLSTLLLNWCTNKKISGIKLGSVLAAAGCCLTTTFVLRTIGTEVGYFVLCNVLVAAPAVYCSYVNFRANQDRISKKLSSIPDSTWYKNMERLFSPQSLAQRWSEHDVNGSGLSLEEVRKLVDELLAIALDSTVNGLNNYFPEGTAANNYVVAGVKTAVRELASRFFESIDLEAGRRISKEEFLTIFSASYVLDSVRKLLAQTTSISGALGLARSFNVIGF